MSTPATSLDHDEDRSTARSTALDGNAVAGLLWDLFGEESTTTVGTCAHCGSSGVLAETVVYVQGPGVVIRCRGCDGVLVVVVERRGVRCVDVLGYATLGAGSSAGA
ncbi:MAG TPA: DUF6510 family protein [Actinotalea sp.]